ncbi:hypothetical protein QCA50_004699 [Cerrena zonata]|uniref:Uncharacterized protein n=1 Tax=Cerrena zonata TaxID=2478898 RepID=A0AAW0GDC0_9APHY
MHVHNGSSMASTGNRLSAGRTQANEREYGIYENNWGVATRTIVNEDEEDRCSGSTFLASTPSTTLSTEVPLARSDSNWSVTNFVDQYYSDYAPGHLEPTQDATRHELVELGGLDSEPTSSYHGQGGKHGPSLDNGHKKSKKRYNPKLVIDPHLDVYSNTPEPRQTKELTPIHPTRRHAWYVSIPGWPGELLNQDGDQDGDDMAHGTKKKGGRMSLKNVFRRGGGDGA